MSKNAENAWNTIRQGARKKRIKVDWNKSGFLEWHGKQKKICEYCNIPEGIFLKVWGDFYGGKRGKRLEIDRKYNNSSYSAQDCVLACSLCNCGKSNKIGYDDFKKAGEIIKKIWKKTAKQKEIKFA